MVDASAVEYARKTLADGYSESEVVKSLTDSGWSQGDAAAAVRAATQPVKATTAAAAGASPLDKVKAFLAKVEERVKKFTWVGWLGIALFVLAILILIWALAVGCYHCIVIK